MKVHNVADILNLLGQLQLPAFFLNEALTFDLLNDTFQEWSTRRNLNISPNSPFTTSALAHNQNLTDAVNTVRESQKTSSTNYQITTDDGNLTLTITLIYITNTDHSGIFGIISDVTQIKELEHDLGERVKELTTIYSFSKLLNSPEKTFEEILSEAIEVLPPGWQYPKDTAISIRIGNLTFQTKNYKQTPWIQTAIIMVAGKEAGRIEVCYLREYPTRDEGPFLKEERSLIDELADRIGDFYQSFKQNSRIAGIATKYRTLFESANDAIFVIEGNSFIDINTKTLEMFGYKEKRELIGRSPFDISPTYQEKGQLSVDLATRYITQAYDGETPYFEWIHEKKGGTSFYVEVKLSKFTISDKDYLLGIVRDISERKLLEIQLEEKFNEMDSVMKTMVNRELKMIELKKRVAR